MNHDPRYPCPPGYAPQQPHYPEAVFVNAPQGSSTSVKNLSVPFLLVIVGAVTLVGVTVTITNQFNTVTSSNALQFQEIKTAIDSLKTFLTAQIGSQSDRIGRMEMELERRTSDRYTRSEHNQWCRTTEAINANNGWKCADLEKRLEFAPRVTGWEAKKP